MRNSQQETIIYGSIGLFVVLLLLLLSQTCSQNRLRGEEGKIMRQWLLVQEEEMDEVQANFNDLLILRQTFIEKIGEIPEFSNALDELNKKYPNFDNLTTDLHRTKRNRKAFEEIVNGIGLYTHELIDIVSKTREAAIHQEVRNALLPYEQDLDILKDKNKTITRELKATKQRLAEVIKERDDLQNKLALAERGRLQERSTRLQAEKKVSKLEQEITQLKQALGMSQTATKQLDITVSSLENEKEVLENKNEQLQEVKQKRERFSPLITIQSGKKRIQYTPSIGVEEMKKRKKKRLQIRLEVPSIQIEEMVQQIFGNSRTASATINIYDESGTNVLSQQMNLHKGKSGGLSISQLPLGHTYRAEIYHAGKNITQNNSFEFKL